jgi:segregation and condensation protein B
MEIKEAKTVIECLLFVSDKPLSLSTLKTLLEDMDRRDIIQCLDELKAEYDTQARAFHLVEIAEGYQMVTRVSLAPWIRKLYKNRASNKLSRAALETMAIVAYRQPISKAEVEDIRGVSADGVMNSLLERKLIRVVGRKEVIGRPLLYGTTKEFLHYFGLKDLSDMPELKDLQDMLRQDEVGEDWELNSEGSLVAKIKTKEETESSPALEPGTEALLQTPDSPESKTVETTEVTMQPYMETHTTNADGGNGHPIAAEVLAALESETAGNKTVAEAGVENSAPSGEAVRAAWKEKDEYDGHYGDDEDPEDDDEDDEDLEDDADLEDAEDDEDEDDEDDEDEDDLEDDDDEDDDDDDLEDDADEDDDDEESEEDDEDDDDLDDIDDLGSPEKDDDAPGKGGAKKKKYYN